MIESTLDLFHKKIVIAERMGLTVPEFQIQFETAGLDIGKCKVDVDEDETFNATISINLSFVESSLDPMYTSELLVSHELAHLLCFTNESYFDKGHGKVWKSLCKSLGGDGKRLIDVANLAPDYKPEKKRNKKSILYVYRSSCGSIATLTRVQHNNTQKLNFTWDLPETGGVIYSSGYLGELKV